MLEKIKLRREKKRERKRLECRKEKLCLRYEMLRCKEKMYLDDNTEYSIRRLENIRKEIKDTLKSVYYTDKDLEKLNKKKVEEMNEDGSSASING